MANWWTFGILLYEMLCGIHPFFIENSGKKFEAKNIKFPKRNNLSEDAKDIIIKLLEKNPKKRLGFIKGIDEIKNHPFFKKIDFDDIEKRKIKAPFIPEDQNNIDINFNEELFNEDLN